MDCKRIKILDGVLDVSLRVLFILSVYNKSMQNVYFPTQMIFMLHKVLYINM